jgi:hypothetical protein
MQAGAIAIEQTAINARFIGLPHSSEQDDIPAD